MVVGIEIKDSCREFSKILSIFTTDSTTHIFRLFLVINNKNQFRMNSEIHSNNTRNNSNFHQPLSHKTIYKEGTFYVGIKMYDNSLPPETNICLITLRNLINL
jgi:hypothetical protein